MGNCGSREFFLRKDSLKHIKNSKASPNILERSNGPHNIKDLCLQDGTSYGDKAERANKGQEVDDEVGQKEEIMHHGVKPSLEANAPSNI